MAKQKKKLKRGKGYQGAHARKVKAKAKAANGRAPRTPAPVEDTDPANEIQPAPRNGPAITLRMRSAEQIEFIKAAAELAKLSVNTWAVEVLDRAARAQQG